MQYNFVGNTNILIHSVKLAPSLLSIFPQAHSGQCHMCINDELNCARHMVEEYSFCYLYFNQRLEIGFYLIQFLLYPFRSYRQAENLAECLVILLD